MNDLLFILPYQSGTLARLAGALADAGIDLQGCSGQQFGPEGIIHLLVEDAAAAREAASRAGFVVRDEREVLVAGIDVSLTDLATGSRLVIGVDDLDRARAVMRAAGSGPGP
jgi:hypothetical protein